jgi:hypothetical protein
MVLHVWGGVSGGEGGGGRGGEGGESRRQGVTSWMRLLECSSVSRHSGSSCIIWRYMGVWKCSNTAADHTMLESNFRLDAGCSGAEESVPSTCENRENLRTQGRYYRD